MNSMLNLETQYIMNHNVLLMHTDLIGLLSNTVHKHSVALIYTSFALCASVHTATLCFHYTFRPYTAIIRCSEKKERETN
jgi:hypothetical protein